MPQYETVFILPPDTNPKQIKATEEKLDKIIKKSNGSIKLVEDWGIKKLAYPIKKQPRGHFIYVNYLSDSDAQTEITRVFNIDDHVLRFANVRLEDDYDYTKAKQTFMPEPVDEPRPPRRGGFRDGGRDGGFRSHERRGEQEMGEEDFDGETPPSTGGEFE